MSLSLPQSTPKRETHGVESSVAYVVAPSQHDLITTLGTSEQLAYRRTRLSLQRRQTQLALQTWPSTDQY